jgi:hypothetical protein
MGQREVSVAFSVSIGHLPTSACRRHRRFCQYTVIIVLVT